MSDNSEDYKLLSDEPIIESSRQDDLEFCHTANVLARAALETKSPITIGVYGNWGTGKTSLMRMMEKIVKEDEYAVIPVWFNAWQYEREEHLIVPLIATIARSIKEEEKNAKLNEKARKTLNNGGKKIHAALRSVLSSLNLKGEFDIPGLIKLGIDFPTKEAIERYESIIQDTLIDRSLYFSAFDELRSLACDKCFEKPQIIVFIDDLDRCLPEKAVHLLESIKLVLHLPNFSFVLGVYPKVIEQFIRNKYAKEYSGSDSKQVQQQLEGYLQYFDDYIDKIVQVYRYMPEHQPDKLRSYISKLIKEIKVFEDAQEKDVIPLIAEVSRLSRNRTSQPVTMCRLERRSREEKPQTFYRRGEGCSITQSPCRKEARVRTMPGASSATHGFLSLAERIL